MRPLQPLQLCALLAVLHRKAHGLQLLADLVAVGKARGRKAALKALADSMESTMLPGRNETIFISHGDSLEDAEYLANLVRERTGVQDIVINYVGPVMGAHAGPGTIALFFWGSER